MKLESLPNEILLDLFDYLNDIDLLRIFYGLNSRFNLLLYKQYPFYSFHFGFIAKRVVDNICQQHLPFIVDRVISLRLSNAIETPEMINLLLSYIPSFKRFTHLQSLTISYLYSYQTLMKILDECQHLNNLIRLDLSFCSFRDSLTNSQLIIDKIWSLPKLTHCQIHVTINGKQITSIPTIISTSLKSVVLFSSDFQWNQINRLMDYTPHMKYFSTFIKSFSIDNYTQTTLSTLTKCNLYISDVSTVSNTNPTFPNMPNLHHLDVHIWSGLLTGGQWEYIIQNYLPQLKTFCLRMEKTLFFERNIEQKADELFISFQTSFWIDQYKWYVRCLTANKTIHLYTRSNKYTYYGSSFLDSWRSTCPDDNQQELYNNITRIYNEKCFDKSIPSNIRLSNIKYLCIKFPINNQFWSIVSNLNRLETLSISNYSDTFSSQLQKLLDRALNLHSLCINQDPSLSLEMSLFTHTNPTIRELDFHDYNYYFNAEECLLLTRSSLGIQCEVLLINVTNRENIIYLVQNVVNLRSLIVTCTDDNYQKQSELERHNDELIQWLKDHLPATYTIVRDLENNTNISIWM